MYAGPLLTLTRAKEGKVFHEISFMVQADLEPNPWRWRLELDLHARLLPLHGEVARTPASVGGAMCKRRSRPEGAMLDEDKKTKKSQFFVRLS